MKDPEGDKTAAAATATELSVPPHQLLEQASKMSVSSGQEAKNSRAKLNRLREDGGFEDPRKEKKQEAFVSEMPESASQVLESSGNSAKSSRGKLKDVLAAEK